MRSNRDLALNGTLKYPPPLVLIVEITDVVAELLGKCCQQDAQVVHRHT
jgi:hypothetical protein